LEAVEDEVDSVSFYEVEKTLKIFFRNGVIASQVTPLQINGNVLILEPGTPQ
jgi:hypothetical protein